MMFFDELDVFDNLDMLVEEFVFLSKEYVGKDVFLNKNLFFDVDFF